MPLIKHDSKTYQEALAKIQGAATVQEVIDASDFAFAEFNPSNPKGRIRLEAYNRIKSLSAKK